MYDALEILISDALKILITDALKILIFLKGIYIHPVLFQITLPINIIIKYTIYIYIVFSLVSVLLHNLK